MKLTNTGGAGAFGELTAPFFQTARVEFVIDRPTKEVWAVLTDLSTPIIKLWNPTVVTVKHISGEPGCENELVLVTKDSGQVPFYMRTIRVVTNQQRVLRCDAVDGSYATFVDHSLCELDGARTKLVYNVYVERCRVSAEEVQGFNGAAAAEALMSYLNESHELLKNVVEQKLAAKLRA